MTAWSGIDLVAASTLAMALFGALLLLAIISRSRRSILGSPTGWRLVASSLCLFAVRWGLHFFPFNSTNSIEHVVGIVAATILPLGLFLVLRSSPQSEVGFDG